MCCRWVDCHVANILGSYFVCGGFYLFLEEIEVLVVVIIIISERAVCSKQSPAGVSTAHVAQPFRHCSMSSHTLVVGEAFNVAAQSGGSLGPCLSCLLLRRLIAQTGDKNRA